MDGFTWGFMIGWTWYSWKSQFFYECLMGYGKLCKLISLGLINLSAVFYRVTIEVSDYDFWGSTPLINKPWVKLKENAELQWFTLSMDSRGKLDSVNCSVLRIHIFGWHNWLVGSIWFFKYGHGIRIPNDPHVFSGALKPPMNTLLWVFIVFGSSCLNSGIQPHSPRVLKEFQQLG